jgi:chromosome segregation ATPase
MGFLFTLASLSAALVALDRETASGRVDLLEALIGSFGVALFSTIGGITLRVFFMQMRREIVDLEEQLRTELQRSAGLLKDQLAIAVMDLENVRIRTAQVLDQQTHEAASGFSRVAEQLVGYVTSAASAYNSASERLAANADRVASEIERLVTRVDKIEVPSDLLTRQVEDARVRIHALASALEAAADAGGKRREVLDQSSKALDLLLTKLAQVSIFSDIEKSADQLGRSMETAVEKMTAVGKQLDQYASSVSRTTSQIHQNSQAVSRARAAISEDLVQSTDALHKLQGTLADVADGLVNRLNSTPSSPEPPMPQGI